MDTDSSDNSGRLKKYNERLFAIFGTIGAILFSVLLAMLVYSEVIKPLLRSPYEPTGIMISDQETKEAVEKGLRLQAASYNMARRLFDDRPYYVIPVVQRTLKEPEMMRKFSGSNGYSPSYYYGEDTNNLIVWNQNSGATEIVLPERRRVGTWEAYLENGIPYLLVFSEKVETVADIEDQPANVIRTSDLVLWVYALDSGARTKIEMPNKAGVELYTLDDSKLAFVRMGDHRDEDGVYDDEKEPKLLYRVDAAAGELVPAVPDAIRARVQKILDGVEGETR